MVELVYETGTLQKGRVHPVVRYTAADGREVIGRTDTHHKAKTGERVTIVYHPDRPEAVEIGTLAQAQRQRLFFPGLAVVLGLAFAIGAFVYDRRASRETPSL